MVVAVGGEEREFETAGELVVPDMPILTVFNTAGAVTAGDGVGAVTLTGAVNDLGLVPGTVGVLPFLPLPLLLVASSASASSFGMAATLVKNIFSKVCAIKTTSSPGLLYT